MGTPGSLPEPQRTGDCKNVSLAPQVPVTETRQHLLSDEMRGCIRDWMLSTPQPSLGSLLCHPFGCMGQGPRTLARPSFPCLCKS